MKKYLMTGIAALALCAGFTSCSHDLEPMSQEEIDQMEAQKIVNTYKAAFEQYIGGKVASSQTWGFKSTRTRTAEPQMNNWAKMGYTVPRELSREQKDRVIAYFQNNKLSDGGQKPWTDFFVQQVYKGGEENGKYVNILKTNPALTTEKYKAANMSEGQYGSNQLDKLFTDTNDHIYNYNGGNCTTYNNVENSTGINYRNDNHNGTHVDQIQLMLSTKAKDFGYNCSQIAIEYNDHYTLVDGSVIDAWAEGKNIGESVSGLSFVGFDFDLLTPEEWYTDDDFKITDMHSGITHCTEADGSVIPLADAGLDGAYMYDDEPVKYLHINAPNMISGDMKTSVDNSIGKQDLQNPVRTTFNRATVDKLLEDGYRPVKGAASTWIKPEITRDYYYSDWIVCIIPGNPIVEENADLRIMAEDLTLGDGDEDFDFNDVVFDVYYGTPETGKIKIKAAGATLNLRIAVVENPNDNTASDWVEVHDLFHEWNPEKICAGKMINTKGTQSNDANVRNKSLDGLVEPELPLPFEVNSPEDADKIKIETFKNGQWIELTAHQGEPAAKFAIPAPTPDTIVNWCNERVSIKGEKPTFADWARTGQLQFKWW